MRYLMQNTLDTKIFGDDIGKSLVKAKEVEGLRKHFQPETYKNS